MCVWSELYFALNFFLQVNSIIHISDGSWVLIQKLGFSGKKFFQSHATQREHEMLKKKSDQKEENKTKKNKVNLEVEKRHEGLQKSIDSSNKGFAMLAKMGYKAGESLGKSNSGRIEPIPIEVKNDRGGLGKIILTLYILRPKYLKVQ